MDILRPTNPDVRRHRRDPAVSLPDTCSRAAAVRTGRWGECAGSGSSGRMFAQAATDSRGGDVAGATPAASLARRQTQEAHVNTLAH